MRIIACLTSIFFLLGLNSAWAETWFELSRLSDNDIIYIDTDSIIKDADGKTHFGEKTTHTKQAKSIPGIPKPVSSETTYMEVEKSNVRMHPVKTVFYGKNRAIVMTKTYDLEGSPPVTPSPRSDLERLKSRFVNSFATYCPKEPDKPKCAMMSYWTSYILLVANKVMGRKRPSETLAANIVVDVIIDDKGNIAELKPQNNPNDTSTQEVIQSILQAAPFPRFSLFDPETGVKREKIKVRLQIHSPHKYGIDLLSSNYKATGKKENSSPKLAPPALKTQQRPK